MQGRRRRTRRRPHARRHTPAAIAPRQWRSCALKGPAATHRAGGPSAMPPWQDRQSVLDRRVGAGVDKTSAPRGAHGGGARRQGERRRHKGGTAGHRNRRSALASDQSTTGAPQEKERGGAAPAWRSTPVARGTGGGGAQGGGSTPQGAALRGTAPHRSTDGRQRFQGRRQLGPNLDRSSTLLRAAHGQAGMGHHGPHPTGPSRPTSLAEPLSISSNFAIRSLDIYIFICLKNI